MQAVETLCAEIDDLDRALAETVFVAGSAPNAADIWLFPVLGWLDRSVTVTTNHVPEPLTSLYRDRPFLSAWRERFGALPGGADTYPPHWRSRPISTRQNP